MEDLLSIISQVDSLIPQLSNFISQFNNIVSETGINVITDSQGNMSIDVPHNMPDSESYNISKRIGVLDRLINTHGQNINDLFQRGLEIEKQLKVQEPNYVSKITDQIGQFKQLNSSYKH